MNSDTENKLPAFLFYSQKWINGTKEMFLSEKGAYVDLLAYQHLKGGLPNDVARLAKIVGVSKEEFAPIWEVLKSKFVLKNDGFLYNDTLDGILNNRKDTSEMRAIIGTFGQLSKLLVCLPEQKEYISKKFDYTIFLGQNRANLSKSISKWIQDCLANDYYLYINTKSLNKESLNNNIAENINSKKTKKISELNLVLTDDIKKSCVEILWNRNHDTESRELLKASGMKIVDRFYSEFYETEKDNEEYLNEGKVWVHFKRWIAKQNILKQKNGVKQKHTDGTSRTVKKALSGDRKW